MNEGIILVGKITQIMPQRSGVTKAGNPWVSQEFVLEYCEGEYTHQLAFEIYGVEKINSANIRLGAEYNVFLNLDSKEFGGKWYTRARAWKVVPSESAMRPVVPHQTSNRQADYIPAPQPTPAPAPTAAPTPRPKPVPKPTPAPAPDPMPMANEDDLPF